MKVLKGRWAHRDCPGQDGKNGQNGRDGRDGEGTNWISRSITVTADEWELKGAPGDLNSYFVAYKRLDELSGYIYDKGSVIAYIETDDGAKHGMPFVLHMGAVENGQESLWTQTYDFDFIPGEIGFYVSYSDFETTIKPGAETFHVVMFWQ